MPQFLKEDRSHLPSHLQGGQVHEGRSAVVSSQALGSDPSFITYQLRDLKPSLNFSEPQWCHL